MVVSDFARVLVIGYWCIG